MPCQKPNGNIHRLNELLFCGPHIPLEIKMIQCISVLLCCQFQYHNACISVNSVVKFEGYEVTSDTVRYFLYELGIRVRPRFFYQVGHENIYASSGNKYFFTKSCHQLGINISPFVPQIKGE